MFIQHVFAQEELVCPQEICCPSGGDCCWTNDPMLFHSIWILPLILLLFFVVGVSWYWSKAAAQQGTSVRKAQTSAQLIGGTVFLLSLLGLHLGIHRCLIPTGTITPYPYEQQWENPVDPPTDILFAVDQSCSMNDDAKVLGEKFNVFINQLSSYSANWQIMVVNDDDGCNRGSILTPTTSDYQSLFLKYVQSYNAKGNDGENSLAWPKFAESLLTMSTIALDKTDDAECNTGFVRENALLHVILVSDYKDSSANPWKSYVDKMVEKKGNSANLRISAIAGDLPDGCNTDSNSAHGGAGYWEAVQETGGKFMSLCSDWTSAQNLKELAEASVISDNYPLENLAEESTIVVFVNDEMVENGWHFDKERNSVKFDSDAPKEGDKIRIRYSCCAEESF